MIRSRLLAAVNSTRLCCPKYSTVPLPTGRAADPAIYTDDATGEGYEQAAKGVAKMHKKECMKPEIGTETESEMDPLVEPKLSHSPSPKLESPGVAWFVDPIIQQKRKYSTAHNTSNSQLLEEVSCIGSVDIPVPNGKPEREQDDKEYFKHHKASPLSDIELVDTRKPITRATDGTGYYGRGKVKVWMEEQLDTAEEALMRGMEIWRQNKMRGDPDFPPSRILRALRGEDW
ncbi:hypothetical protein RJ641_030830 [Dillenia turbinata]|uniref:Uncharacterized protein n=1 Tax=Dillenia turbinata TaxID=194707 RepID=A0AAN8ZGY8_9MAGN